MKKKTTTKAKKKTTTKAKKKTLALVNRRIDRALDKITRDLRDPKLHPPGPFDATFRHGYSIGKPKSPTLADCRRLAKELGIGPVEVERLHKSEPSTSSAYTYVGAVPYVYVQTRSRSTALRVMHAALEALKGAK